MGKITKLMGNTNQEKCIHFLWKVKVFVICGDSFEVKDWFLHDYPNDIKEILDHEGCL